MRSALARLRSRLSLSEPLSEPLSEEESARRFFLQGDHQRCTARCANQRTSHASPSCSCACAYAPSYPCPSRATGERAPVCAPPVVVRRASHEHLVSTRVRFAVSPKQQRQCQPQPVLRRRAQPRAGRRLSRRPSVCCPHLRLSAPRRTVCACSAACSCPRALRRLRLARALGQPRRRMPPPLPSSRPGRCRLRPLQRVRACKPPPVSAPDLRSGLTTARSPRRPSPSTPWRAALPPSGIRSLPLRWRVPGLLPAAAQGAPKRTASLDVGRSRRSARRARGQAPGGRKVQAG